MTHQQPEINNNYIYEEFMLQALSMLRAMSSYLLAVKVGRRKQNSSAYELAGRRHNRMRREDPLRI